MTPRWIILILLCLQTGTGLAQPAPSVPQLTITGQSELDVPADELRIRLGVSIFNESVETARTDVDTRMNAIVKAVGSLGLESSKDFHTSRYSVQPKWSQRPRQRGQDSDWKPSLLGYQVTSAIQVKTSRLDVADQILAKAVSAGANDIGSLQFNLADPRTSRDEAIEVAAQNAINDARVLADATGVQLIGIREMSINNAGYNPIQIPRSMAAGRTAAPNASPVMAPSQVRVSASVTIVYEIESNGDHAAHGTE